MTRTKQLESKISFSIARRPTLLSASMLAVMFLILSTTPAANAAAMANNVATLESLAIVPVSGSITFSSSTTAFAYAEAINPLMGIQDSQIGPIAFASAVVNSASANSFADSISGTGFAVSTIYSLQPSEVGIRSDTSASPYYIQESSFSITGTTGPVLVQFSATVPYLQSLASTDARYVSSFAYFYVFIQESTSCCFALFAESDLYAAPHTTQSKTDTWNLSNSLILEAGQTYTIGVQVGDGSFVGMPVPEPATLSLVLAGILSSLILRPLRHSTQQS